jgi:aldose 1-epimerase
MIESAPFGELPDGRTVTQFTLANRHGTTAQIIEYGGILTALWVADRDGAPGNVVLGCRDLDGYVRDDSYFGALIGRYANRIAKGRFSLDGTTYQLTCGDGAHTLHGGKTGFNKVLWRGEPADSDQPALVLRHVSPDGDEGFPGRLAVEARYALTSDDALTIEFIATTDRPTVVNLCNHAYFNLAGEGDGDVHGHDLMIAADAFTPVDAALIPTGDIRPVAGTPFDFRKPAPIGRHVDAPDEQILRGRGFDHNFVLRPGGPDELQRAAIVREPRFGRVMEVWTTEPGLQLYGGNGLDGSRSGASGRPYGRGAGFCLETQAFPDSPNQPGFPATVLRPGEVFRSRTEYRFSIDPSPV